MFRNGSYEPKLGVIFTDNNTVLVIDDDKNILKILELYLKKEGFDVVTCEDGAQGFPVFKSCSPALVVLDVMLPGKDGFEVIKEIRADSNVPVIMLTAKGATLDRVQGLNLGADDYMAKPFDAKELIARIKAVLRRTTSDTADADDAEPKKVITRGALTVSMEDYTVTLDGKKIDMAPKELELLSFLMTHEPHVFTREQLLDKVWGFEYFDNSRTVDVHVKRVREKLGTEYAAKLMTVWGVGYKFDINGTAISE